jgi:hypothetical protein
MAFKLAAVATRTAAARSGFPPLIGDRERCEPFRLGLPAISLLAHVVALPAHVV